MSLYTKPGLEGILKQNRPWPTSESALLDSIGKDSSAQENLQKFNIFLSHSYLDKQYIFALKLDITRMGFSVYVDWDIDKHLERGKVNRETADLLRKRMKNCDSLVFATSLNSSNSKWMPWELGYCDGLGKKVAILPVLDNAISTSSFTGQEYLTLYPYVMKDPMQSGSETLWVHENEFTYIQFKGWLTGKYPYDRR